MGPVGDFLESLFVSFILIQSQCAFLRSDFTTHTYDVSSMTNA